MIVFFVVAGILLLGMMSLGFIWFITRVRAARYQAAIAQATATLLKLSRQKKTEGANSYLKALQKKQGRRFISDVIIHLHDSQDDISLKVWEGDLG